MCDLGRVIRRFGGERRLDDGLGRGRDHSHDSAAILTALCDDHTEVAPTECFVHSPAEDRLAARLRERPRVTYAATEVVAVPRARPRGQVVEHLDDVVEVLDSPAVDTVLVQRPRPVGVEDVPAEEATEQLVGSLGRVTEAVWAVGAETLGPQPLLIEVPDERHEPPEQTDVVERLGRRSVPRAVVAAGNRILRHRLQLVAEATHPSHAPISRYTRLQQVDRGGHRGVELVSDDRVAERHPQQPTDLLRPMSISDSGPAGKRELTIELGSEDRARPCQLVQRIADIEDPVRVALCQPAWRLQRRNPCSLPPTPPSGRGMPITRRWQTEGTRVLALGAASVGRRCSGRPSW